MRQLDETMPHQPLVSKKEAHLFEELNIIDVGIVNEDIPDYDGSSSSHISSPGRLLHRSRKRSDSGSPPPPPLSQVGQDEDQASGTDNGSDADEMSIATTVSSLSSIAGNGNDNDAILSQYPEVKFEMSDQQDFFTEVNDWFVMNDLTKLGKIKLIFDNSTNLTTSFMTLSETEQRRTIDKLTEELTKNLHEQDYKKLLSTLICFNYLAMGCYDEITDQEHQKSFTFRNLTQMIGKDGLYQTLFDIIQLVDVKILKFDLKSSLSCLLELTTVSHYAMTILYLTLCFILDSDSQFYVDFKEKERFTESLNNSLLLLHFMRSIDLWRWLSSDPLSLQSKLKQAFKIRNVIILISKLILLEFGGSQRLKSTKSFLKTRFGEKSDSEYSQYNVSPLDYHFYKEDLKMRYPSFVPPDSSLSKQVETNLENVLNSKDRSQSSTTLNKTVSESLINEPFSQRRATALNNSNQNPPDIHIATPAPSPTLTPITFETPKVSQQEKFFEFKDTKKFFQNTSSYPYLYPADEEAPYSIKEASKIFFNSVKEDINTKQFMGVFEDFIIQERGVLNTIEDSSTSKRRFTYDETDIVQYPQFKDEITSLIRVEEFYDQSLSYLNSLVKVLLQTIESSSLNKERAKKFNHIQEKELTKEETSKLLYENDFGSISNSLKQKYEIARVKEITLKYSSQILHQLLKWFKISHVLKFEFLSMIIFDNNYYQICLDFLATNLEESTIHLNNHNDYLVDHLNDDDPKSELSQKFNNDKLAYTKFQYYSEFDYNRIIKDEFTIPDYNFFQQCLHNSSHPDKSSEREDWESEQLELFQKQNDLLKDQLNQKLMQVYYGINNPKIFIYNWKYCFILTNLLNVLYYTMSNNKTQRVNQLIEKKPTELLKFYLKLHNKFYYRPILKIIKLIIPFNGRKWKSNNMDSISMIYLYYKVGLKDDWLTNNYNNANLDIGEELKRSYKQEYSLRSLLQYYNIKYYQREMSKLGYEYYEMDYFNKELEILSRLYLSSQNGNNE